MAFIDSLIDDAYALIQPSLRMIGTIIPDCAIEEHHFDRVIITEHPVETGAAITDHAFRAPSEVVMKIGFSNSTAGSEGWVQEAYQELLALQQARQPFDVYTGKRPYTNMLVDTLEVTTDPASEYALNCTAALREIIITSTSQTSSTPQSAQSTPDQTSGTQQAGSQQLNNVGSSGAPSFQQSEALNSGQTAGTDFQSIGSGGAGGSGNFSLPGGFTPSADPGITPDDGQITFDGEPFAPGIVVSGGH